MLVNKNKNSFTNTFLLVCVCVVSENKILILNFPVNPSTHFHLIQRLIIPIKVTQTGFEMPSTYDLPENYIEQWRSRKFREEEEPENTSQEFEFRLRNKSSSSNSEDDQASTNPKL